MTNCLSYYNCGKVLPAEELDDDMFCPDCKVKHDDKLSLEDFANHKLLTPLQLKQECRKVMEFVESSSLRDSEYPVNSFVGNKILYHFQILQLMNTKRGSLPSFKERISDEKEYVTLWENTIKRKRTGKMEERMLQCHNINKGCIALFKTAQAIHCYRKFDTKGVLDVTAGWGGRLLGSWALGIDYTGIDTNLNLMEGYDGMIKMLYEYDKSVGRKSPSLTMIWKNTLSVDYETINYDLILTSPPYYNLEVYEYMNPFESNKAYISWLNKLFSKCFDCSKTKNLCINISPVIWTNWNKLHTVPEYTETIELKQQKGNSNRNNKKGDKIYVWS